MEYVWYVIAALGAGVGTGLAGLSAATVMVPILIVLCPSFAGVTGVYHATAIALASDILGSAVTAAVYIRHKNIDLKRGWLMMVCIVVMCVAGSYAAFLAGNVVLGSFSLFLTFFIGIRFLIKPDSRQMNQEQPKSGLSAAGIAVSLFFGLTIGFGTGFVGTGGGMMMLIVFTAFLKMNQKEAVGTSTFIMTFTALIAAVSHIVIDPTIFVERLDVMLICIVTATIASLVSAQFANRVSNRTVGLATGGVLTVLGAAMLLLHYWDKLNAVSFIAQVLQCSGEFLEYIGLGALALIVLRFTVRKLPSYVFRKLLHLVAFTSVIEMIIAAQVWYAASVTAVLFAALVYPILLLVERCSWYDRLFVQKKKGEIKQSLLLLFLSMACLIAFTWGVAGKKYIAVATILMWGFGDAAAALVGIRFGKHPIKWRFADGKKTWEGSIAMALTAFITGAGGLALLSGMPWPACLLQALAAALPAAITELVSRNGTDTVSVPFIVALILSAFSLV